MTNSQLLRRLKGRLPAHEARLIACACLGISWARLLAEGEKEAPPKAAAEAERMALRREAGEPLQYILGTWDFYGLTFRVDSRALIPRPDTELLVEQAVSLCRQRGYASALDLCTGSGCVAVALSRTLGIAVTAADVSEAALSLCRENARINQADIQIIQSDLFSQIRDCYHIITCNPPYIPTREIAGLAPEVKDNEPLLALDGGGDGLDFYRRIAPEAKAHLLPGGALVLEVGIGQAEAVAALLEGEDYREIQIARDYGGVDRVVRGVKD